MSLNFIKDLAIHGTNLIKILNDILLGTEEVKLYDANNTYDKDALIIHFNSTTNKFELLQCLNNGVTGVYNSADWTVFQSILSNGSIDCGEF